MDKGNSRVGQTFKVKWGDWALRGSFDLGVNKNYQLCNTESVIPVGSTGVIVGADRYCYEVELTLPSGDFFERVFIDIADLDPYVCPDEDEEPEPPAEPFDPTDPRTFW